jgi:putative hemolysin
MAMNVSSKRGRGLSVLPVVCLYILALIVSGLPQAAAQSPADGAAHSYCVKMGYLYRSSPGVNGGQGICEFPDKTWCDARAYYSGQCGPSLSVNFAPFAGNAQSASASVSASTLCRNAGGRLESVHTPYGDVTLCVFPNGRTCDIQSLYNGMCGGDNWLRYAQSWLNAP